MIKREFLLYKLYYLDLTHDSIIIQDLKLIYTISTSHLNQVFSALELGRWVGRRRRSLGHP